MHIIVYLEVIESILFILKAKYSQMLFCMFNHSGVIHLGFNMFALYNISDLLARIFPAPQFLGKKFVQLV